MDIMDFSLSDFKAALSNPDVVDQLRKMDPKLARLSEDDLNKAINNVGEICDKFKAQFGDLTAEEVIDLGMKQKIGGNSTMTLDQAFRSLRPLSTCDKDTLEKMLKDGSTLLLANQIGSNIAFETVLFAKENILYSYKLTESTPEHIVLTLYRFGKMEPGLFEILYEAHISKTDMVFEDANDIFKEAEKNTWGKTESDLKELLKKDDVILFKEGNVY